MVSLLQLIGKDNSKQQSCSVLVPPPKPSSEELIDCDEEFMDCDEKCGAQAMNLPKNSQFKRPKCLGLASSSSSGAVAHFKGPGTKFQSLTKSSSKPLAHKTSLILSQSSSLLQSVAAPQQQHHQQPNKSTSLLLKDQQP